MRASHYGLKWMVLAATLFCAGAVNAGPQRVVSLNLCADQYLLALAAPDQIAALTPHAADPGISFLAEKARAHPAVQSSAEAVMEFKPDLVLASRFRDGETKTMLRRFGIRVEEIARAETVESMIGQTRRIAALIGQQKKGAALVNALTGTAALPDAGPRPTALAYQRRGYISGSGTIVAEMLRHAGADNHAESLGRSAVSRITLEELVLDRPDFLILDAPRSTPHDIGSQVLHHPVLKRLFRDDQFIHMPSALAVCGGPSFPAAVETLRRALHPS